MAQQSAGGFRKGEKVSWKSSGGTAHGKVERVATSATRIEDHEVKATKDDPQLIVKSDNGDRAAHKPTALKHDRKG